MKKLNRPFFSIIIPSYNQAKFLRENLASIQNQNFLDWEAIIMDGGSTDDSVDVIKSFKSKNPGKVWWQSKKDGGQVIAINTAIKRAKGTVVSYLNSDDKLEPFALDNVYYCFKSSSASWLYGDCEVSKKTLGWTFRYKQLWPIDMFPKLLYLLNPINQPSVYLKRQFVKKVGYFDTDFKLAFDYEYWLRCAKVSAPLHLKKSLAYFRVHKQAKSSVGFEDQFNEELKALRKHNTGIGWYTLHKLHNIFVVFVYTLLK